MPELPDVTLYVEHLGRRLVGAKLLATRVVSPNLLRTVEPSLDDLAGRAVTGVRRMGKRIVVTHQGDLHLVFHLMIAGRFRWKGSGADVAVSARGRGRSSPVESARAPARAARNVLGSFEFTSGTLVLTEAGTRKRASLHVVRGAAALRSLDPGGLEVLEASLETFREALLRENHTLKRALTDPRLFSGIGNAYSDEVLHRARLSPFRQTRQLDSPEIERLFAATRGILETWTERLRRDAGEAFPERVTAFREGMAVHGRYRQPCPDCGSPVQQIVYTENECNYCARCQTGGRLLADRALSRLLKGDWPRTLEELEK